MLDVTAAGGVRVTLRAFPAKRMDANFNERLVRLIDNLVTSTGQEQPREAHMRGDHLQIMMGWNHGGGGVGDNVRLLRISLRSSERIHTYRTCIAINFMPSMQPMPITSSGAKRSVSSCK